MKINLLEALTQVPDFRASRGQGYPLWLLLLLVLHGDYEWLSGWSCLTKIFKVGIMKP